MKIEISSHLGGSQKAHQKVGNRHLAARSVFVQQKASAVGDLVAWPRRASMAIGWIGKTVQPRCRKRCNTAVPPASNKWTACPADDVSRFVRFIYGHQRRGDGQFGAQSSVHLNCPAIPVWDSNANREMPKIVQKLATPAHVPPACLSARTIQITAVLHPIALHGLIDTRASLWFMHFSLWQHIAEI